MSTTKIVFNPLTGNFDEVTATIDASTDVTGTLPTANGGTGTNQTFTPGSIVYADSSGNFTQDNSNLFWDATNKRLSLQGHLSTAAFGVAAVGSEVGIDLKSTATNTALNVQNEGAQFVAQFTNSTNSATQGAAFGGAFSRGTITARTAVQAGDQVATFSGQSYNGASFGPGYNAAVAIVATENQTATHNGGEIVFATTPNGSLAPIAGLIVNQDQTLQLPHYTTNGFVKFTGASGTVGVDTNTYLTAVSVATANGFAGSSSGGATPALTLTTSVTGVLKGNGTAISAATSGTDYSAGTSALATGILKSTTTTGALTIAVAGDFPTLNQNTSGTAANVTGIVATANGGTNISTYATGDVLYASATNVLSKLPAAADGTVLTLASGVPSWAAAAGGGTTGAIAKNYLINSNFDYWQRTASKNLLNGNTQYTADRWYCHQALGTNSVVAFARVAGTTSGSTYGCSIKITTAPTAAPTTTLELLQTIENPLSIELLGKSISASILIKALGNVNSVGVTIMYATTEAKVTTALSSETTVTVNSSTFTAGSVLNQAVGTTPTASGVVGIRIRVLGVSSGAISDLNNGFVVEQAILNVGSTAATYIRNGTTLAGELAACQRFYEKSLNQANAPGSVANNEESVYFISTSTTGNRLVVPVVFKVAKRVSTGTLTTWDLVANSGKISEMTAAGAALNNNVAGSSSQGENGISMTRVVTGATACGLFFSWELDAEI